MKFGVIRGVCLTWVLTWSTLLTTEVRALDNPLDVWQYLNPFPISGSLNSVVFCNGQFVGMSGAYVLSSLDGTNWVTHFVPGFFSLGHLAFGNALYVAVGSGPGTGAILTSTNLNDWTVQYSGTTNSLNAVAYGNGLFVAVGNNGVLLTSTNGANWVQRVSGTSNQLGVITFGNGVFVVGSGGGAAYVSADGVNWSQYSLGDMNELLTVSFSRGLFLAGGEHYQMGPPVQYPRLYVSGNGTNWSQVTVSNPSLYINALFTNNTSFFASDSIGLLTSVDGTNFSRLTTTNCPNVTGVSGYGGPSAYTLGNGVFVSRTLQTAVQPSYWNLFNPGPNSNLVDIAYGNGVTVAVGDDNIYSSSAGSVILVSSNGLPFVAVTSLVSSSLHKIQFANGLFHAVGNSGTLLRSTNGVQWVQRNSGTTGNLWGLGYGNGLWIAVGNSGTISTSPSGQAWTLRFSGTSNPLYDVTYGNNLFVAVGNSGTLLTSPDGITWTAQFNPSLSNMYGVTYGEGLFVAVGEHGTIVTLPDGINWDMQNSGTTNVFDSVTFAQGVFVAVGAETHYPAAWSFGALLCTSTNGVNWVSRNPQTSSPLLGTRSLNGNFYCVGIGGVILKNPSVETLALGGWWNPAQGQFEAVIKGGLYQAFRLQSRSSLTGTTWSDLVAFTNAPDPVCFPDPNSTSHSAGFYRLVSP